MAELLALRYRDTARSILSAPTTDAPTTHDPDTIADSTVPWGAILHVSVALDPDPDPDPDPDAPPLELHCWGIGPECGGLATLQPVHIGAGFFEWVIGTEPDVPACHSAGITECWLTDPTLYQDPPADFGNWGSLHTARQDIAAVIPPEARLACVLSTPPALLPRDNYERSVDLPATLGLDMRPPAPAPWVNPSPDLDPEPATLVP